MVACATHHASAALGGLGSAISWGICCGCKICCVVSAFPLSLSALLARDCRDVGLVASPGYIAASHSNLKVTACTAHSSKFASLSLTLPLRSADTTELCASVMGQHTPNAFSKRHLAGEYVSSPDPMLARSGPTCSTKLFRSNHSCDFRAFAAGRPNHSVGAVCLQTVSVRHPNVF